MMPAIGPFWRSAVLCLAGMGAVVALQLAPVPASLSAAAPTVSLMRRTATTRGLSAQDREEQTAGYYQELLNQSAAVVVRTPRCWIGWSAAGRPTRRRQRSRNSRPTRPRSTRTSAAS